MIFLIQSPHSWSGVWQRPHHLAFRFTGLGHAVRYVEPRYPSWLFQSPRRFFSATDIVDIDLDVRVVTLLNGERFGPIRALNKTRLASRLKAPIYDDAGESRILWLYNPHEGHLAETVPHDLLVYDMMDEYAGFPWSPPRIEEEERALLERADWVFAGTHALHEAKEPLARGRIECIPSGVTRDFFAPPPLNMNPDRRHRANEQRALRARYERLIGYAGVIDLRVDQELIASVAGRRPEWGWIFLGPVRCDVARLRKIRNVHLLGEKNFVDLPPYYHGWDAAVIPFVENTLTRHVNPTKILEYAAAELPVVARALPDVERYYSRGAFLYRTPEEFEAHLTAILSREEPIKTRPIVEKRAREAEKWMKDRSWDAIAARMLDRIKRLLRENNPP